MKGWVCKMGKIIGIGDNVVDKYLDLKKMFPGGNALNVPVLAKKYHGVDCGYIGVLGNDAAGKHVYSSLIEEDIDVSHVRIKDGKNSYAKVTLVDGDRVFVGSGSGVPDLDDLNDEDFDYISSFEIIHTSVYSRIEKYLLKLKQLGRLSFDYSDKRDFDYFRKTAPYIDYAFVSGSNMELSEIMEMQVDLANLGPSIVLVTRGEKGAIIYKDGKFYEQGIEKVDVIDTLGAGDAFIARLLVGILGDEDIKLTLKQCAKASAKVCMHHGAFGYPKDF